MRMKKFYFPLAVYDIYIRGEEEKLNCVRKVVNELARYGGVADPCPEKLNIPLKYMMMLLVGSENHSGFVIFMNTDDSECVILQTETEEPHALCNALKECFSDINTEIKNSMA
jgi:hypothetical protein